MFIFFFFKQKTAYEMLISDWSSDVCSSDLPAVASRRQQMHVRRRAVRPLPSAAHQRIDTGSACRQQRIDRLVAIEAYRQRGISLAQKRPRRVAPACVVIGSNRGQTRWRGHRSEEHTSELQSLMRISYAVF